MALQLPNVAHAVLNEQGAFTPAWIAFFQSITAQSVLSEQVARIEILADEATYDALDPKDEGTLYIYAATAGGNGMALGGSKIE